jgi:biopolymer transport protein ExbB/TolQ
VIGILIGLSLTVVAPSCGLLGTMIGLGHSFQTVGSTAPEAKAKTLADGISIAMNSTLVGLALVPVGVGILVVSLWFWRKEREEEAKGL